MGYGGFPELSCHVGGPYNKRYSILVCMLESPYFMETTICQWACGQCNQKQNTGISCSFTVLEMNPRAPCRHGIYLGPKVIIWEPLWALSIYYIATWSLWGICNRHAPSRCLSALSIRPGKTRITLIQHFFCKNTMTCSLNSLKGVIWGTTINLEVTKGILGV